MRTPRRKNIRLQGFDYASEGAYFVTIVTKNREPLFGQIVDGEMVLNALGEIVREEWIKSAEIRNEIQIDEFVVMPNHFHAIVYIFNNDSGTGDRESVRSPGRNLIPVGAYGHSSGTGDRPVAPTNIISVAPTVNGPRPRSLGALVRGFKSAVTTRINQIRNTPGNPVWQRNYYDHIIGTDREYERIAEYVANNPSNWMTDDENPE